MADEGAERMWSSVWVQPPLQGNSKQVFLQIKQSKPGKRLDFWESDWGRVGLGPADGMRVLSGITQQPQPLSGYCLLAQMGSPGEVVSLARAPQLSGPSLVLALSSSCKASATPESPRGSVFLLLCLIRAEVLSLPQSGPGVCVCQHFPALGC